MLNADPAGAKAAIGKAISDPNLLLAPAKNYDLSNFNLDNITPGENIGKGYMDGVQGEAGMQFYYNNAVRIGTALWNQMSDAPASEDGSDFFDPRAKVFMDKADQGARYVPLTQGFNQRSDRERIENGWRDQAVRAYDNPRQDNGDEGYYGKMEAGVITSPVCYNFVKGNITNAPEIWHSAADIQFLLAEIYARADMGYQDMAKAKEYYITGIITSVKFWYDYAYNQTVSSSAKQSGWVHKPAKPQTADINRFLNHPKVNWDSNTDKLGLIYTQRWIECFLRPHEAFYLRMEKGDNALPYLIPEAFNGLPAYYRNFRRLPMHGSEVTDNYENYKAARGDDAVDTPTWWQKK
jgi:hypothetical protein